MATIYVDVVTGTYGSIFDLMEVSTTDTTPDFDELSDSEIIDHAKVFGKWIR